MKILLTHRPGGAYAYISDGWQNALRAMGHVCERWDGSLLSWHIFDPDIAYACSGHRQPIPSKAVRGDCKIAIHVNPYGPINIPGINENKESIDWVVSQKPSVVFGYGDEADRSLWEFWTTKHGIKWVPMPTAGDNILYNLPYDEPKKLYDIVYVGGYWQYKAKTIDPYLLPLLDKNITYKLHGWGDWPKNYCSGAIEDRDVSNFLNSGRVAPCMSEEHTHTYGIDIPERVFKTILSGALAIHDNVTSLKRYIPSLIIAKSPKDYQELCYYYSRPEQAEERKRIADLQRSEVLEKHTYINRMKLLLSELGY